MGCALEREPVLRRLDGGRDGARAARSAVPLGLSGVCSARPRFKWGEAELDAAELDAAAKGGGEVIADVDEDTREVVGSAGEDGLDWFVG